MTYFESGVEFTEDFQKMSDTASDTADIREEKLMTSNLKQSLNCTLTTFRTKNARYFEADFANDIKFKYRLVNNKLWD